MTLENIGVLYVINLSGIGDNMTDRDVVSEAYKSFEKYWAGTFRGMSDSDVIKYKNVGRNNALAGFLSGHQSRDEEVKDLKIALDKTSQVAILALRSMVTLSQAEHESVMANIDRIEIMREKLNIQE